MTKILYVDIETTMHIGGFFQPKTRYMSYKTLVQPAFIAMIQYADISNFKVPSKRKVKVLYTKNPPCDKQIITKFRDILAEYDVVVGHNSDRFDIKRINAKIMEYDLDPLPAHLIQIDTLKEIRKVSDHHWHALEYLADLFDLPRKGSAQGLWHIILKEGPKKAAKAIKDMIPYGKQDIVTGSALFLSKMKYFKKKLNIAEPGSTCCPHCTSSNFQKRGIKANTSGVRYQWYFCNACRAWFKSRYAEKDKPHMK